MTNVKLPFRMKTTAPRTFLYLLNLDSLLCCFFPIPPVHGHSEVSEHSTRMPASSVLPFMALNHSWLSLGAPDVLLQPRSVRKLSGVIFSPQIFYDMLTRAAISSTSAENESWFLPWHCTVADSAKKAPWCTVCPKPMVMEPLAQLQVSLLNLSSELLQKE